MAEETKPKSPQHVLAERRYRAAFVLYMFIQTVPNFFQGEETVEKYWRFIVTCNLIRPFTTCSLYYTSLALGKHGENGMPLTFKTALCARVFVVMLMLMITFTNGEVISKQIVSSLPESLKYTIYASWAVVLGSFIFDVFRLCWNRGVSENGPQLKEEYELTALQKEQMSLHRKVIMSFTVVLFFTIFSMLLKDDIFPLLPLVAAPPFYAMGLFYLLQFQIIRGCTYKQALWTRIVLLGIYLVLTGLLTAGSVLFYMYGREDVKSALFKPIMGSLFAFSLEFGVVSGLFVRELYVFRRNREAFEKLQERIAAEKDEQNKDEKGSDSAEVPLMSDIEV